MKFLLLLLSLFFVSSCGSLRVSPLGCKSPGYWGDEPELGKMNREIKVSDSYLIWNADYEVKLRDLLKANKIDCADVKKMRIEIKSVFFVKRELNVFITK